MAKKERWTFRFIYGFRATVFGKDMADAEREARERARMHGWTDRLGRVRILDRWREAD